MRKWYLACGLVGALLAPNIGRAGITFQYVTDASTYSGAAGSSATVSVYLQETDSGGNTLFGSSTNKGLASYGVYVTQTSSGGTSSISSFTTAGSFNGFGTSQSVPNQSANANSSSSASLPANSIDYFNSVPGGTTSNPATLVSGSAGNGVYKVLVGTLGVTVGTSTTFSMTSMFNSPGDGANAGGPVTFTLPASGSYNLDPSGTFSGASGSETFVGAATLSQAFTVGPAAVPEPSSILLCSLMASGIAGGAWRRWRRRFVGELATV
jgi:hypothetical protein